MAVSGDTVVVGAHEEDSNATGVNGNQTNNSATDSGAAYVFVRNGTNWSQQAYLKASNTGADDDFGYSVAVSGDTVVVGAHIEGQQRHRSQRQPERQQRLRMRARPTSSCATGRTGVSRPISKPPTPTALIRVVDGPVTISEGLSQFPATRWWSGQQMKTAMPPE